MTKRKQKSPSHWADETVMMIFRGSVSHKLRIIRGQCTAEPSNYRVSCDLKHREWVEDNEQSITLLSNYQRSARRGLNSPSLLSSWNLHKKKSNLDILAGGKRSGRRRRRTFVEILAKLFMTPKVKQAIIHEFKGICSHTAFPTRYMRRAQLQRTPFLLNSSWELLRSS